MSKALFDPGRHVSLAATPWSADRVRDWLRRWARDALAAEADGWPLHPRDVADFPGVQRLYGLYAGALGVWLALAQLAEAELIALPNLLGDRLAGVYRRYCTAPDTGERVPSWFLGETALLTVLECLQPQPARARKLGEIVSRNRAHPSLEALWGAPGTMLAPLFLWERSRDPVWAELFRDSAAAVLDSWKPQAGLWLWEQDLYGKHVTYLGAGHGWAGNLYPLWRGQALLTQAERAQLLTRSRETLAALAVRDGHAANWPATPTAEHMLLQWCHGAPGVITSLRYAPDEVGVSLLCAGGETICAAGPLSKGVSLCHGTDGNGMALLALHARTGDSRWLAAARQFAMWALSQSEAAHAESGQWRYSLWTGDAGLACFLLACLSGKYRGLPGLDRL